MSGLVVGIDLGTSTTVVAHADAAGKVSVLADEGGAKIQPSVVSFHPNGGVIVGAAAKQRKVIDPQNTIYSVKRLIGRSFTSREVQTAGTRVPYKITEGPQQAPMITTRAGTFAVPEISAIVLDHARHIASTRLGTPVHPVARAVVTVPASFNDAQRAATATAGAIAGLEVVRVLNEPTAAALAYGHARDLRQTIAVYDFGGGTFDVTILRLADHVFEVLGTAGDTFLGGDDLDERIVDRMVAKFLAEQRVDLRTNELAMMRLRAVAEATKIELSRRARAIVRIDEIAYGESGAPLNLQLELTRDELVAEVADIIDRTFPVCQEALALAGLGIDSIDEVILVGGTTKIPYVRDQVSRFFGKAPRTDVNAEEAVAVGAALQASTFERPSGRAQVAGAPALEEEPTIDLPSGATMAPAEVTPPPTAKRPRTAAYPTVRPDTSYTLTRGGMRDVYEQRGAPPAARPLGRMAVTTTTVTATPTAPSATPRSPAAAGPPASAPPARGPTSAPPPRPPPTPRGLPAQRPPAPRLDTATTPDAARATEPRDADSASAFAALAGPGFDDSFSDVDQLRAPAAAPQPAPSFVPPQTFPIVAPPAPPPVVLEVTPRGLGIATVAGYCEELIGRNARLPAAIKRLFTTARDRQEQVRIVVCQGDSRRIHDNTVIGDLVLANLPLRPRGETSIEVTFSLDATGILQVQARDAETGRVQTASLDLVGGMAQEDVEVSRERVAALRR